MEINPIKWVQSVNNFANEKVFNTRAGRIIAAVAAAGVFAGGAYATYATANLGNVVPVGRAAIDAMIDRGNATLTETVKKQALEVLPQTLQVVKTAVIGAGTALGTKFFAQKAMAKPEAQQEVKEKGE